LKLIAIIAICYSFPFALGLLYALYFFGIGTYVKASFIVVEVVKIYALAFALFDLKIKDSFSLSFKTISGNFIYNLPIIFIITCPATIQSIAISFVPESQLLNIIYVIFHLINSFTQLLSFILISIILNEKIFKNITPELSSL